MVSFFQLLHRQQYGVDPSIQIICIGLRFDMHILIILAKTSNKTDL
jgi:hypothetical protein